MSVVYNGIHSITFIREDDSIVRNTWGDFHLVPAVRPHIEPPPAQVKMLSLPRSNKILDLTNALTRDVIYDAREGDWEFYIDHDKWEDWTKSFDAYADYFDGSVFYLFLDDEPNYIYHGRVYVADYKPDASYSKIRIHYNLDPIVKEYKWELLEEGKIYTFGSGGDLYYDCDDTGIKAYRELLNSNVKYYTIGIEYEPIIRIKLYGIFKDADYKCSFYMSNYNGHTGYGGYLKNFNIGINNNSYADKKNGEWYSNTKGSYNVEGYFTINNELLSLEKKYNMTNGEYNEGMDYYDNDLNFSIGLLDVYGKNPDGTDNDRYGKHGTEIYVAKRKEGIII